MPHCAWMTKLVLAAFAMNAALCPCAPPDDLSSDVSPEQMAESAHAGHHSASAEHGSSAESDVAPGPDCHDGVSIDDCDMVAGLDIEARTAKVDQYDSGTLPVSSGVLSTGRQLTSTQLRPPRNLPPAATPLRRFDRLLI